MGAQLKLHALVKERNDTATKQLLKDNQGWNYLTLLTQYEVNGKVYSCPVKKKNIGFQMMPLPNCPKIIVGMVVFTKAGTLEASDKMCISIGTNDDIFDKTILNAGKPENDSITLPAYNPAQQPGLDSKQRAELLKMQFKGHKICEDRKIYIENPKGANAAIGSSHAALMFQKLQDTLVEIKRKFAQARAGQPGSTTSPSGGQ